jgi:UDP-N-acetylmuramoylalanine--D-glutamate ligase
MHLLAGGADKGLDPSPLAEAAARHQAKVYLFAGTATPALESALRAHDLTPYGPFPGMAEAVAAARYEARAGDVVLLSPGCASFGLFRDEFDRGDRFRETVVALGADRQSDDPSSPALFPSERGEEGTLPRAVQKPPLPAPTGEGVGG